MTCKALTTDPEPQNPNDRDKEEAMAIDGECMAYLENLTAAMTAAE